MQEPKTQAPREKWTDRVNLTALLTRILLGLLLTGAVLLGIHFLFPPRAEEGRTAPCPHPLVRMPPRRRNAAAGELGKPGAL